MCVSLYRWCETVRGLVVKFMVCVNKNNQMWCQGMAVTGGK